MKNSKLLTSIIITLLIAQLFAYASIIQVNGQSIPTSTPTVNPQNHNYINGLTSNIENGWRIVGNLFDWWSKYHHPRGNFSAIDHITISPKNATIIARPIPNLLGYCI